MLIAVSVLLGVWIVSSADDRVLVWSAARDLAAGTQLQAGDLQQVPVRMDNAGAYIGTESGQVVGRRLTRPVGAGELIPLGGIADRTHPTRLVTVPVEPLHAPLGLAHGDRVDVYVSPRQAAGRDSSQLVLSNVLVHEATDPDDSATGETAVVLETAAGDAASLVAAARGGVIDLVRVPLAAQ